MFLVNSQATDVTGVRQKPGPCVARGRPARCFPHDRVKPLISQVNQSSLHETSEAAWVMFSNAVILCGTIHKGGSKSASAVRLGFHCSPSVKVACNAH